jgi:hypothetical protein
MLHAPGFGYSLPVAPLDSISRRADNFFEDEGSLLRGRELVHVVGPLDASEDEVANVKGSFLNAAIVVMT